MKLIKQETGKKSAKFLYSIVDENGNVLTTRSSNREYVAATICGKFFFGRLDLIGKGDHGRYMNWTKENIECMSKKPANELMKNGQMTNGKFLELEIKCLQDYQTIAKL
jgi:hypothetical protein